MTPFLIALLVFLAAFRRPGHWALFRHWGVALSAIVGFWFGLDVADCTLAEAGLDATRFAGIFRVALALAVAVPAVEFGRMLDRLYEFAQLELRDWWRRRTNGGRS